MNAERGDEGIPDYFKSRLNNDVRNDLLQEAVFRELWYSDSPVHSLGSLESKFDESRQTVGSRLNEMVEQGVLDKGSINSGDYWWIDFPESNHPLPADVAVHPKEDRDEMSVSDFFNQLHTQFGVFALLITVAGGAIVWFGALQSAGVANVPLPVADVLSVGLLTLFASYLFLLFAVVVWVVQKAFLPEGETVSFRRMLTK
ncbi:hypothetical protein [Natronomonas sp. EA1]|uniref:hypothetical protein n=1 Tax=Natronomonas sp. EA1 TaxID=3421655 RepID=UPI003EC106DD